MLGDQLRERVQARLSALGINPFEAERRAHLKRGYLNDLLIGKKQALREKSLAPLSQALECDLDFLTGLQATPRRIEEAMTPVAGVAELGVWREKGTFFGEPLPPLPIAPDPRFPACKVKLFVVHGEHAAGLGITGGSLIWVLRSDGPFREGDILLTRRERGDQVELAVRVVSGGALSARPTKADVATVAMGDVEIEGQVVSAVRVFGLPN